MIDITDLSQLTDLQLKYVSDLMKINGQQLLDFDKKMDAEVKRRYGTK